uniref:Uncharacterized protein n=1 Tax=Lygus hesperus TaxID=30085 RepID=A0A0K8SFB6_LYGHE
MSRQEELLKMAQEAKARLEGNLQEKEAYIAKKQKTIQSVSEELIKANEIIGKLQKELNTSTTKLKMRTEIALEQEKVIERHEKTVERLEKELKVKSKKLGTLDVSEETLKTTIAELKETLDAKEKKIKENEKIIDWLNRRCTEAAVQSYSPYTNMGGNQSLGISASGVIPGTLASSAPTPLFSHSAALAESSAIPNQFTGNSSLKTSTPLGQFKDARKPFTPPSRLNILALDKMETPVIEEEESSENEDPSPKTGTSKEPKWLPSQIRRRHRL